MNNKTLTNVALRYRAVFLDINRKDINMRSEASVPVMAFAQLGTAREGMECAYR